MVVVPVMMTDSASDAARSMVAAEAMVAVAMELVERMMAASALR